MKLSNEVSDSSDWSGTPLRSLTSVDSALRCQVCKEFLKTPMITTCSHTFCSLCIRRSLTEEGKCPTCRAPEQLNKLRKNTIVEELTEAFEAARPKLLEIGSNLLAGEWTSTQKANKRKFDNSEVELDLPNATSRRQTRYVSRQSSGVSYAPDPIMDEGGDVRKDIGFSQCPICQQRMKTEAVYMHLDTHDEKQQGPQNPRAREPAAHKLQPTFDSLPAINYSILTEAALRKKLQTLGIPSGGTKAQLSRRHTEFVNVWNANCDSTKPRTKRQLLQDLDQWERSQGSLQSNTNTVMSKNFDGQAWSSAHGADFQDLIAQARRRSAPPVDKEEPGGYAGSQISKGAADN